MDNKFNKFLLTLVILLGVTSMVNSTDISKANKRVEELESVVFKMTENQEQLIQLIDSTLTIQEGMTEELLQIKLQMNGGK